MPNTEPTLTGLAPFVTFGENAVNAAPVLLDVDVVFGDAEGIFTGGELTVGGLLAEDRIAIRNQGFATGQIGVFGVNVTYNGVAIGVISGGVGTTFRVRFNSDASTIAIDALIQNLTYANVSNTPTAARTLLLRVADDQNLDVKAEIKVNVTPESDIPLLTGFSPSATFTEDAVNTGPVVIDSDAAFVVGSAALAGGRLTVSGLLAEDRVAVRNEGTGAGQIGVSGSNVTYGGAVIGTVSGGTGATLFVTLTAAATQASVDALIQNLTYANASNTPTASRTLHIGLLDGAGIALNATLAVFEARTGAADPFNGADVGSLSAPSFVDLDGDGDLDSVIGTDNGQLRSFRNTGGVFTALTGTANPFNGLAVGAFSTPSFVDLDGDGDLDAVVGESNGMLRSFRNTGGVFAELTGTANPFNGVAVGSFSAPSFVDLDGDGDLDAVVGESGGTLRSFRNTGGVFVELTGTANPLNSVDVGRGNSAPSFVDLDGDGDLDAVVGETYGMLRSFRNTGGAFAELTGTANPLNGVTVSRFSKPSFADLDGDGDLDLVVGGQNGTLRTYINTAANGANVTVTVTPDKDPAALTGVAASVTFAENAVNAAPAVIDSDVAFGADAGTLGGGRLSVSGLLAEDRVAVRNQGTGSGQIGVSGGNVTYGGTVIGTVSGGTGATLFVTLTSAASQASIDALIQNLTYANVSDAPTASRTLHIGLLDGAGVALNATSATFVEQAGAANPFNGVGVGAVPAPGFVDLDGDGDLDAVVGAQDGTLRSFRNSGGVFTELTGTANPFNDVDFGRYSKPSFVDLDGDGDLDAVVGAEDGTLRSFRNTAGVFVELIGTANPFSGGGVGNLSAPSFVDLDGDGDLDAVVGGAGGTLQSFRNTGGVFTALTGTANPFNGLDVGSCSTSSFVDLDGDSDLDAVVGAQDGTLRSFRNTGGVFTALTGTANPFNGVDVGNFSTLSFVDVDGDGDLDAVVGGREDTLKTYINTAANGANVTVTVTAQSDVPTLTGLTPSVSFAENAVNAAPAVIDSDVAFSVGTAGLGGGRLTVSGLLAEDRVAVRNEGTGTGQIGVSGSSITYGGVAIGTVSGGVGGTLFVTLTGAASQAAVDTLIQNLTYANVSDAPTASRTLHIGLLDGAGIALNATAAAFEARTGAADALDVVEVGTRATPSFVDLDGDGDLDAVVGERYGTLRSFRNTGGVFVELTGAANPFDGVDVGYASAPGFEDLDGDGDLDMVLGAQDGTLRSFRNTGGMFAELTGTANPFNGVNVGYYSAPSFVDLDGDGDLDAVVGEGYGTLRSFRNTGGVFAELTGAANPLNAVAVGGFSRPSFVDLDGDSDLDAVVGAQDGTLRSFRNTGGSFTELTGAANPFNGLNVSYLSAPSFVDLDGDGDLDAVVGEYYGTLKTYINTPASGANVTITVTVERDGPRLSGVAPSVTFAENAVNAAPAIIDGDVVFTDELGLTGGTLTVSGLLAEDRVAIRNQGFGAGEIGLFGVNITYEGVAIGTFSGGVGGTLSISLNSAATAAAVDALIQNLTYASVSDTPTASRTLHIDLFDGGGAAVDASGATITIAVTPEAEVTAPTATNLIQSVSYTEDAASVGLGDIVVTDPDADGTIAATLILSDPAAGTITGLTAGANGRYTVSGSVATVNAALAAATFIPAPDSSLDVTIAVSITDGTSPPVTGTITLDGAAVNDTPRGVSLIGAMVVENAARGTLVGTVAGVDPDAGDTLAYSLVDNAGGRFAIDAGTGQLSVLNGALLDYETARSHAIRVQVRDAAGAAYQQALTIELVDAVETREQTLTAAADVFVASSGDNWIVRGLAGDDRITTLGGDDVVTGGAGNDTIDTGAGNDIITFNLAKEGYDAIDGGAGVDRIDATAKGTVIGLRALANVEFISANGYTGVGIAGSSADDTLDFSRVVLTNIAKIDGGAGNDAITGSTADDQIIGGAGNDRLDGDDGSDLFLIGTGAGTDAFDGGGGRDGIVASARNAVIGIGSLQDVEYISSGGFAGVVIATTADNDTLDLSGVTLTGIAKINLGAGNDVFTGSAGDDYIVGGVGDDTLNGGAGNDVIEIGTGAGSDRIDGGEGIDTIKVTTSSFTWTNISNVEALLGSSLKLNGTTGDDLLDFGTVSLTGVTKIYAGAGNDSIIGSAAADVIGLSEGRDVLTGGGGADIFDMDGLNESRVGAADLITDFAQGSDIISLVDVDASTRRSGNQTFTFIGEAAFTGAAGELYFVHATDHTTTIYGDVNGDRMADFQIDIASYLTLIAADFRL